MQEFLKRRINLVKTLVAGDLPVVYADLVLILCAVLSACGAVRWPGRGIDKKRFIELLISYSAQDYHTSWVSVPALLNDGLIDISNTPYGNPGNMTRIYLDDEIDLSISDAKISYPYLSSEQLRKYCYASIIYEWLRCGYSHEYCPHENITEFPPSRNAARISYIGRSINNEIIRMVSFHIDYLISLADYHVSILPSRQSPIPPKWWIDSG